MNTNLPKIMLLALLTWLPVSFAQETKIYDDKIEQRREGLSLNKVVFVDHSLNRVELNEKNDTRHQTIKVSLQRAGARRTPTNSLEAWSVLKNHTDYNLQVEGRVSFFDADEIPLDDVTAWKRVYIPANSVATYRDFSINPQAAYFVIELREGL
ncbi:hypothetical protein DXV75_03460 [Alteromonas aestuariivivens]|uniref:Uncharacterized protein n=1 Tax=Alteromonas aestuariivivens TaxID=1938339 RepID=A0A3D8MCL3_9ALTE|nr:DUF1425 domain-containing protein [Alteromonas aestuariivivens]RDV28035.1 hypothetical protein DXV75_03460 [Alteromonas aestuariivivens]